MYLDYEIIVIKEEGGRKTAEKYLLHIRLSLSYFFCNLLQSILTFNRELSVEV